VARTLPWYGRYRGSNPLKCSILWYYRKVGFVSRSSNGRIDGFDPFNLGSTPSLETKTTNNRTSISRKVVWPELELLVKEISNYSKSAVARRLGVSEAAVRKMLKRMKNNNSKI
jgi:hypothetical protein